MACETILNGINLGCENGVGNGGLKKMYILPSNFLTASTEVSGNITVIGTSGTTKYKEYEFIKFTANYVEAAAINKENGSTFFTQTVTLNLPKRDVTKRNEIALLGAGQRSLNIVVLDQNDTYWMLGKTNGAQLTTVESGSGMKLGDGSMYTITMVAEEPYQAYTVSASAITSNI